jgi:enoyl-CoA hydratase/carnithine racemase
MNFISLSVEQNIATIVLTRPKVNAINESVVEELDECFHKIAVDPGIKAVILTGEGSFFSFGLDVPEFLGYAKDSFIKFLTKFTGLYGYIFQFPKPVVAALNGHTIAGGCMLALACDYRLMVSEKARISLNEITFGSTVFAGSVQMLKYCLGEKKAESVLYRGAMYSVAEATGLGLIDEAASKDNLREAAQKVALGLADKDSRAFQSIKMLLRSKVVEEIKRIEKDSILDFADIWYSESTWEKLKSIKIRD